MWRRGGERPPPGTAKIRHASIASPFRTSQEESRSRATVGRSYAAQGPASCLPRLEGSHPGPARATVSARRLEPAPTASVSVNPGARPLGGPGVPRPCRESSTGCGSETRTTTSPDRAPARAQVGLLSVVPEQSAPRTRVSRRSAAGRAPAPPAKTGRCGRVLSRSMTIGDAQTS